MCVCVCVMCVTSVFLTITEEIQTDIVRESKKRGKTVASAVNVQGDTGKLCMYVCEHMCYVCNLLDETQSDAVHASKERGKTVASAVNVQRGSGVCVCVCVCVYKCFSNNNRRNSV